MRDHVRRGHKGPGQVHRGLLARGPAAAAALAALLLACAPAWAGEGGHDGHAAASPAAAPAAAVKVGVTERLGEIIPEGIILRDEAGQAVDIRRLMSVPTILAPVYYTCPTACSLLLGWLAQVLPQVGLTPGRDYQVVSVSFDETDTPELASRKRRDFTTAAKGGFPPEHWRFLTGEPAAIEALMAAIGFGFKREGKMFQHPVVLVAVSPKGKITRYLYGGTPLAFDIAMAATEAAGDSPGVSITRALAFCYSYDSQGQRYVFNVMRVAGVSVLLALLFFAVFLYAGGRKRAAARRAKGQGA